MNEALYRKVIKEISFGYAYLEHISMKNGFPADFRILDVNSVFESITGFNESELVGKKLSAIRSNKNTAGFDLISFYEKIKLQESPAEFEYFSEPTEKWYRVQFQIPESGFLLTLFHDITATKNADINLRESESRFRGIFESTPLISVQGYNRNREVIYWNHASEILYGYSQQEALGRQLEELIIPAEMQPEVIRLVNLWLNEGIPIPPSELTLRHADGSIVQVFSSHVLLNNMHGDKELFCIDIDLSKQKQAEKALLENEANLKAIIENSLESIWSINTNYEIQYVNDVFASSFFQTFGVRLHIGTNLVDALPESLKPIWKERYDRAFNNEHFVFEDKIEADDAHIYIEVSMNPIVVNGNVVGASFFGRDVSIKKTAEEELIKQSALRKLLMEVSSTYINLPLNSIETEITNSLYKIGEFVGADRAYVFSFDSKTGNCTNTHEWCQKAITPQLANLQNVPLASEWIEQFRAGQTVNISDLKKLSQGLAKEILEPQEIKSLLAVPMLNNNECIGFIGFDYVNNFHNFSNDEHSLLLVFAQMLANISLRKTSEEALIKAKETAEESEEKHRFLFENMTQGVVYHSSTGEVIYANKAASRILGLSIDQLFGKTSLDPRWRSIREDGSNYPGELHPAMITLESGKEVINEIMGIFNPNENSYSWININSIPKFKPGQSKPYQVVVTFEDITEIRNARERAEESNRLKTAFLQNMSHEIRTPMNAILGFLELLKEPDLKGDEKDSYIDIVNKSGERLLYTINDIIEISKIESGQADLVYSDVNISDVLKYHHSLFFPKCNAKGLLFELSPQLLPEDQLLKTDRHKLDGILTNLINNAIKFTNKGIIKFGNYLEDSTLVFYVEDSGIGIPANRFDAIFNRFVQADLNNTRPYEGSGLGLSIAKAYAEMLGGKIWVKSEVGKGSTFFFSIPYIQANIKKIPMEHHETEKIEKRVCILIAEDDEFSFQYLENILKDENITILRSINGEETLINVENNPDITLVLMDIKMPGMDGLEATKRIRKFNKKIPIIAQTAYALDGDREKTIEAGCNDYISKPVNRAELIRLVNKYS